MISNNERLDDLGRDGLALIQNPDYFCFGIDAVLLSSFAKVHSTENVIDLCSGNGIIPVLLSAKTKSKRIVGLEIQNVPYDMAKRSIIYNNISARVEMVQGDVKNIKDIFPKDSFKVVTANPPYMKVNDGIKNESEALRIARHEELLSLEDLIKAVSWLLCQKGRFYMVHRPLRLTEILSTMSKYNIEPKSMRLVHPYINKEPNMVLIEGIKGASKELRIAPPLIVYDSPGKYTKEVMEIYGYE